MKNAVISFFVSRLGGILTPVIAGVVGIVVAKVAALSPDLANSVDQVAVTAFVVGLIVSFVNYKTNSVQTDGIKKIQALVNTTVDGVPGPVTYTEVRRAIALTEDERSSLKKRRKPRP